VDEPIAEADDKLVTDGPQVVPASDVMDIQQLIVDEDIEMKAYETAGSMFSPKSDLQSTEPKQNQQQKPLASVRGAHDIPRLAIAKEALGQATPIP
jgi:hypothetical protein